MTGIYGVWCAQTPAVAFMPSAVKPCRWAKKLPKEPRALDSEEIAKIPSTAHAG